MKYSNNGNKHIVLKENRLKGFNTLTKEEYDNLVNNNQLPHPENSKHKIVKNNKS